MATQQNGQPVARATTTCMADEQSKKVSSGDINQPPELFELGTLAKLQHYGFKYNDGKRYKDDY